MIATFPPNVKRWTFDQFLNIAEMGFFDENPHVELIDGVIHEKMPQKHPHFFSVSMLNAALKGIYGAESAISVQSTVRLSSLDGPEPDIALFRGAMNDYRKGFPDASDLTLVIEVGDTSLGDDKRDEAPLYARFAVPEFWIVDVRGRRILVHRSPQPETLSWGEIFEVKEGESVAPLGRSETISVADILPDFAA
ncbi:Uma2 family endonuclease [soil metagenome]